MATPCSLSERMTRNSSATSSASSDDVGSSRISTLAFTSIAGDRDELLHRERVVAEQRRRVDVEVEPREELGRPAAHRAPVDAAEAARLAAEQDVLGHGQVREEVDLLVHRGDAGGLRLGGAAERDLLARERDRAGVDAVHAGQGLDEGRLARAVLAHERVHLAGEHAEVDAVERLHAREADRDAAHLDDRRGAACGSAGVTVRSVLTVLSVEPGGRSEPAGRGAACATLDPHIGSVLAVQRLDGLLLRRSSPR